MKKLFYNILLLLFLIFIVLIILLSTIGIETKSFNDLIISKIYQSNNNIKIKLETIKFKLDIKKFDLFLETANSNIDYRNSEIPIKNIKVFTDIKSLLLADPKIEKVNIELEKINLKQLQKLSNNFKPSNLKNFINNNIIDGKFSINIQIFPDKQKVMENFIVKGTVNDLKTKITNDILLENTYFNFFADKTDVLIKNLKSKSSFFEINEGDLFIKLSENIQLNSNFKSKLKYDKNSSYLPKLLSDSQFVKDLDFVQADLNNTIKINFDQTYKIQTYNVKINGNLSKALLNFEKSYSNLITKNKINNFSLKNSSVDLNFNPQKKTAKLSGKYSIDDDNYLNYDLFNSFNKKNEFNLNVNFDYEDVINLGFINYEKPKKNKAKIFLDIEKKNKNIEIKSFLLSEKDNLIKIGELKLEKKKIKSFKNLKVKTIQNGKINNDFQVKFGKKIEIIGKQFDATKLFKNFNKKNDSNIFQNLNKEIEIDLKNVAVPFSEQLKSFRLLGQIENGQFSKISSKGDFGGNNFLDINLKKDKKSKKKYLEVYSDLPQPLLSDYTFFKGLSGGKLLFSSIIDKNISNSKLLIEDFKVKNAPGMIKLLSLADLGGLADLAAGDGLSFDMMEINMERTNNILKLSEIIAIGPSISVLMEGYQDEKITSIRGTLVPAKTLNKFISKIPVIGEIIIPKEVGEGVFGISFKMKGPPGKIKTTINPIRTLTPRFIQKIIEKNKNSK